MSPAETRPERASRESADELRRLPSEEEIAAWREGAEILHIGSLLDGLSLVRFDGLYMQIRKEELIPQHWQAIATSTAPPDEVFDGLPEVARLKVLYGGRETAVSRLASLQTAWRELRGKRPALWTVPDLLAAIRRIIAAGLEVPMADLLTATRDLWLTSSLPAGKDQLDILWNCLVLIRKKTKS